MVAGCCHAVQVEAPVQVDPVAVAEERTVKVEIDCPGEDRDTGGTGVRYRGNLVVTAAHVVDDAEGCEIALEDAQGRESAFYVTRDDLRDLGLLMAFSSPRSALPLARPKLGMGVWSVGYPVQLKEDGRPLTVTRGVLAVLNVGGMHRVTAPVFYGNSGGGIWDERGALVGIAVEIRFFRGAYVPDHSRVVPARAVARFVEAAMEE